KIASSYYFDDISHEDILAQGYLGFSETVQRFDLSKKFCFSTYLTYYVRGKILDFINSEKKHARCISLYEGVPCGDKSVTLIETIGDGFSEDDLVDRIDLAFCKRVLNDSLPSLSPRQREVVHLRYREDRPSSSIASLLGISCPRVTKLESQSIEKLRR